MDQHNNHHSRSRQAHLTLTEPTGCSVQSGTISRQARLEPTANPKTLSVPEAGRIYFDLGRNASYAAAARGEIPTLRVGARLRVPVRALERMLEAVGSSNSAT